jgi:hypothetical protein
MWREHHVRNISVPEIVHTSDLVHQRLIFVTKEFLAFQRKHRKANKTNQTL